MSAATRPLAKVLRHIRTLAGEPADKSSDAQLLDRFVRRRDDAAFAELVSRHGPLVLGVAHRWLADKHEADDVVQSTFLALARQAKRLDRRKPLSGWLYTVAFRLARKAQIQSSRRERLVVSRTEPHDPLADITGRELLRALDEELAGLPERYRVPLLLCNLDGLTRDEAAARLGLNLGAIRGRLERGRELLRKRLEARGLTLPVALAGVLVADGATALSAQFVGAVTKAALAVPVGAAIGALKMAAVAGVMLVALGAGAGLALRGDEKKKVPTEKPPVADAPGSPVVRVDGEGVPLPEGALARIGSTRMRHPPAVSQMLFTPDGKTLLSAGFEGIRFWDVATGKLNRELKHPSEWHWPLMHWADGSRELRCITSNDTTVLTAIDALTGKELRRLDLGNRKTYRSKVLSPSGSRLALTPFEGKDVRICDSETGRQVLSIPYPPMTAMGATYSPDERWIIVSTISGAIHLHDANDGKLTAEFKRDGLRSGRAEFSPDSKSLAVVVRESDGKDTVVIWDVPTGKVRFRLEGETLQALFGAVYSPDGKWIATHGQHNDVSLWDADTGKEARRLRCFASVLGAQFSPDSKALAIGHGSGYILLWNVATGELLPASPDPPSGIYFLRFSDDGRQLIAITNVVRAWDATTGREVHRYPDVSTESLTVLSPDRKLLAGMNADHAVTISDAATGRLIRALSSPVRGRGFSEFTPDSRRIVASDIENNAIVWDAIDGRQLGKFSGISVWMTRFTFSPDGRKAAANWEKTVQLLDMQAYRKLGTFQAPSSVMKVAFSPDGRLLAAVGGEERPKGDPGFVQIWDVETASAVRSFAGHTGAVSGVGFSPDGRMLATGGGDATLRFWEVANGGERLSIPSPSSSFNSIAFAPDGKTLATASFDEVAYIWEVHARNQQPIAAPSPAELDQAWTTLADQDAKAAFAVIRRLVAAPDAGVALVRDRLKPASTADATQVRELIRQLDSGRFEERQKATQQLMPLADRIGPELRAALAATKSAEVRQAIQRLLERGEEYSSESLRAIRAVEILEHIATPAAREHLRTLAAGAPCARLTEAAAAALKRIKK